MLSPNGFDATDARPSSGDHVTAVGRWVFDCGHAAKTELHPLFALESDHDGFGQMRPGGKVQPIRLAKIWFNSAADVVTGATTLFNPPPVENKPLDFDMKIPEAAGHRMMVVRVTEGDPNALGVLGFSNGMAHLRITPPTFGKALFRVALGFVDSSAVTGADSFTVHLDEMRALNDKDDHGTGEWYQSADVNGAWKQIWWDSPLDDGAPAFPIHKSFTVTDEELRMHLIGYEDDDPFPGDQVSSGVIVRDLKALAGAGTETTQTPSWRLFFHVDKGPPPSPTLSDVPFWTSRLADEPNDEWAPYGHPTDFGTIPVSQGGGTITHPAFITEQGAVYDSGRTHLQGIDVDRYEFETDDFSDIAFGAVSSKLKLDAVKVYSQYSNAAIPQCVKDVIGWRGGQVDVRSATQAAGDVPYTMTVITAPRQVPGDWGEPLEGGAATQSCATTPPPGDRPGFRPVDLTKELQPDDQGTGLTMPFAWQHVPGDVDKYAITFPEGLARPAGQPPCQYDQDPSLAILAPGMKIRAVSVAGTLSIGQDEVTLDKLGLAPDMHVLVAITHPQGKRDIYRLSAEWDRGEYFTKAQCEARKAEDRLKSKRWVSVIPVALVDTVTYDQRANPLQIVVRTFDDIAFEQINVVRGSFDAIISAPAGQDVAARLYDDRGVLVGESTPVQDRAAADVRAQVPDGLQAQSHLDVTGLNTRTSYTLQAVLGAGTPLAPPAGTTGHSTIAISPVAK